MAKGKYHDWLTEDGLRRVEGWARDGLSDKQICINIGITQETFYQWSKSYPSFSEAVKKGKAPVDIEVENALLKRALGYKYEEITEEYDGRDFKKGEAKKPKSVKRVTKEVAPDVGAIAFWLKNRRPDKWRDRPTYDGNVAEQDDGFLEALMGIASEVWEDE